MEHRIVINDDSIAKTKTKKNYRYRSSIGFNIYTPVLHSIIIKNKSNNKKKKEKLQQQQQKCDNNDLNYLFRSIDDNNNDRYEISYY